MIWIAVLVIQSWWFKQKQRGLRVLLCRWPSITECEMYITAQGPVPEMTYTVSSGTLNPSIPYLMVYPRQRMSCTVCCSGCFRRSEAAISSIVRVLFSVSPALVEFLLLLCLESDILFLCFIAWCKWLQVWTVKLMDDMLWCWRPQNKWRATYSFQSAVWSHLHNLHGLPSQCTN